MNEFSKFLREFEKEKFLRLFMPGHQGKCSFLNENISPIFDLTEIEKADDLYSSKGVINSLEEEISSLFSANCCIGAGGSTLFMQTILWLLKDREFVAQRASHFSFCNAAALFSISVNFIGDHRTVEILEIEKAVSKLKKGSVLFITSPNYYGEILDIAKIREICGRFGVLLFVDCAHGSHLAFTKNNLHPIYLGADVCFCSFHKTLPCLTGASAVFFRDGVLEKEKIKRAMALFGSSSPSYLIMDSIGLCLDWLKKCGKDAFIKLEEKKEELTKLVNLKFLKTDPCKLVLDCSKICGGVFYVLKILRKNKIEPEFYNKNFVCFILTPFLKDEDWTRLFNFLKELKFCEKGDGNSNFDFEFKKGCGLKEALFARKEKIKTKDAVSRIFVDRVFSDIPGVLLLNYGERLTQDFINFLEEKNIEEIYVVKEKESGILF